MTVAAGLRCPIMPSGSSRRGSSADASASARLTRWASPPDSESALRSAKRTMFRRLKSRKRGASPGGTVEPSPAQRQLNVANHGRGEQSGALRRIADPPPDVGAGVRDRLAVDLACV